MRKSILILATSLFSITCLAQNGFYIGYENGGLFDRYHYVNSKGYSLTQRSLGAVLGGYLGYKHNSYNLEVGFFGYHSAHPNVVYDYNSGVPSKSNSTGSSEANWMIPIRLGKEFTTANDRFFLKPVIAFNTIICRRYSENQTTMVWGENISFIPNDPLFIPTSPDSTRAYGYFTSKMNFGIESGLSAGYRFKNKADIYIKGSYLANFSPLYYERITHYSATETVNATSVNVNSLKLQIGLKYYFAKPEK